MGVLTPTLGAVNFPPSSITTDIHTPQLLLLMALSCDPVQEKPTSKWLTDELWGECIKGQLSCVCGAIHAAPSINTMHPNPYHELCSNNPTHDNVTQYIGVYLAFTWGDEEEIEEKNVTLMNIKW